MPSHEEINSMHSFFIKLLEENDCSALYLILFSSDVATLSQDLELLPLLKHFDELVMALLKKFRNNIKNLLETAHECDRLILLECFEDIELIAKERNIELLSSGDTLTAAGRADKFGK